MTLRIGVDVGGTFTDLVAYDAVARRVFEHKVLTTPENPATAVLRGLRELLEIAGAPPGAFETANLLHGTTLVANTLIERKAPPPALLVTRGARDIIETGRENRYDPYDRLLRRPAPLVPRRLRYEVAERLLAGGVVHRALDRTEVESILRGLPERGVTSAAVVFLHSYTNPAHEHAVREIARDLGLELYLSLSSDVAPEIGEWERMTTTAANAYVQPVVDRYLRDLREALRQRGHGGRFYLMWSDGGLASVESTLRVPIRLAESGPAGGALAACHFAARLTLSRVIAFDMGGTTAKICLVREGEPDRSPSFEVARVHLNKPGSGIPLRCPSIHMLEIGAGGGSIAAVDALGLLKVGPHSAGANPGPACYGLGGTDPTVTDANLVLGYLADQGSLADGLVLDRSCAVEAFQPIAARLQLPVEDVAAGVRRVITENMAQAVKLHVTERGEDPREYVLMAFGGAAPLHAYDVARTLGIRRVVVPHGAGVLSALGFLTAAPGLEMARTYISALDAADLGALRRAIEEVRLDATRALRSAGVEEQHARFRCFLDMRCFGQGYEVPVPVDIDAAPTREGLAAAFTAAYRERYGIVHPGAPEIRAVRVRAEGPAPVLDAGRPGGGDAGRGEWRQRVWFDELAGWTAAAVRWLDDLVPGTRYEGPLLVQSPYTMLVVGPSATLTLTDSGDLVLDIAAAARRTGAPGRLDPVDLEILLARLRAVADEADRALLRTAFSSVVRDGKDYSLVIADTAGNCLALPTECMPLFVTSMPRTLSLLVRRFPVDTLRPGDVLLTNDPWMCAGHKSDLLLAAPVFHDGRPVAFIASIVHVPDIGGVIGDFRAWDVHEEGLALPPLKLYEAGRPNDAVLAILAANVRVSEVVLGDLGAMQAAIGVASRRLLELLRDVPGLDLGAISREISTRARGAFVERLRAIPRGMYRAALDADGIPHGDPEARRPIHLEVAVRAGDGELTVDFTGSDAQRPHQAINVPIPYTIADTIYALQYMLAPGLPNVGPQFSPVRIVAPEGSILNALPPVPVFARTRTGVHIATLINRALAGVAPDLVQAQCGHNLILSMTGTNDAGRYYSLILMPKGGMGATGGRDGWDVTVFPTNCTMPSTEVSEMLAPILLEREMTRDTGGAGRERGGVGQTVTITSLARAPLTVAFRPNFVEHPAAGLNGGLAGAPARVEVNDRPLTANPVTLGPGESCRVWTAGGGGMGRPVERDVRRVAEDIAAGLVSVQAAHEIYGIAVDPSTGRVADAETARLRGGILQASPVVGAG